MVDGARQSALEDNRQRSEVVGANVGMEAVLATRSDGEIVGELCRLLHAMDRFPPHYRARYWRMISQLGREWKVRYPP